MLGGRGSGADYVNVIFCRARPRDDELQVRACCVGYVHRREVAGVAPPLDEGGGLGHKNSLKLFADLFSSRSRTRVKNVCVCTRPLSQPLLVFAALFARCRVGIGGDFRATKYTGRLGGGAARGENGVVLC